jgi:hypothetical protein
MTIRNNIKGDARIDPDVDIAPSWGPRCRTRVAFLSLRLGSLKYALIREFEGRVPYSNEDCEGGVIFVPWGIGILDCLARRASSLDRTSKRLRVSRSAGRVAEGSVIGRAERRSARATAVQGTSEC